MRHQPFIELMCILKGRSKTNTKTIKEESRQKEKKIIGIDLLNKHFEL